jgi:hypothetical protein
MRRIDKEAMQRAIQMARAEDEPRKKQIDAKLKSESFEEVGAFASYHCQCRALLLRPWQSPPSEVDIGDEDTPTLPQGGRRAAAMLLRRMLDNKLSRFEPDPVGALQRIEQHAKAS